MEPLPLDPGTAASFLRKLGEHLDCNINIMDREGVIIASRDQSRVGSYHDVAQRLIATGAGEELVAAGGSLPAGVRPGVNLPIVHRGETIGVVGVTGDPAEVRSLAYAVKTSLESMIELEAWKENALRRQDSKNLLMNYLVHEDGISRTVVESLAAKLGYAPGFHRVPLLLAPPRGIEASDALRALKGSRLHGAEDISWATPEGALLVWKSLRFGEGNFIGDFEAQVRDYVAAGELALGVAGRGGASPAPAFRASSAAAEGEGLRAWAGAVQTDLGRYREAYRQVLWLAGKYPGTGSEVVFLYEHLLAYLASRIPRSDLVTSLDGLASLLPADSSRGLRETMDALLDAALNGKEAAARLGVHRNTFASRMERLARLLGRDPRRDPKALDFLSLLARYLELRGPGG
jgi:carbohydrate diacid regulator